MKIHADEWTLPEVRRQTCHLSLSNQSIWTSGKFQWRRDSECIKTCQTRKWFWTQMHFIWKGISTFTYFFVATLFFVVVVVIIKFQCIPLPLPWFLNQCSTNSSIFLHFSFFTHKVKSIILKFQNHGSFTGKIHQE